MNANLRDDIFLHGILKERWWWEVDSEKEER
jgi:hypothetical protein